MLLTSQKKHHSAESDTLSIFLGQSPRFPTQKSRVARVGLSTATPPRRRGSGVSVAIPIAKPE